MSRYQPNVCVQFYRYCTDDNDSIFYSNSYKYLSVNDWDKEALTEMLRFSIPLIPTSILWWLISGLNRPLLEDYVGLFALGLMAVAGKLPGIMNLVFNFFQQAWIVTVVEEYITIRCFR